MMQCILFSVVIVDFGQDVYTFNENDGYGTVEVTINRNIAQDLLVGVIGGLFIHYSGNYTYYFLHYSIGPDPNQPYIEISGANVSEDAQFTFEGSLSYTIRFPLINDTIGLEDIENYTLILGNPRPTRNVELGNTEIDIVDDDGTYVIYIMNEHN